MVETATLQADGDATAPVQLFPGQAYALSVSGAFTGTVQAQRSFDGGNTWHDLDAFAAPVERDGTAAVAQAVRVRATSWSSGSATVELRPGPAPLGIV